MDFKYPFYKKTGIASLKNKEQNYIFAGRERTLECKFYWYPKIYKHITFVGSEAFGTFC